jgi:hypothetical protein
MQYVPRREVRKTAVEPAKFAEFFRDVIGSPLPGETGLIGKDCPEKGPQEPAPDPTMRCISARVCSRRLDDGRVEVELVYLEVE